jgi:hypothetical protein
MPHEHRLSREQVVSAILQSVVLGVACLITYVLVTQIRSRVYSASRADDLIGGLWAVIGTIFVLRTSYQESVAASVSRLASTLISFALCLVYLIFLPSNAVAVAGLIAISALVVLLLGQPANLLTACVSTAVVMVVAVVEPQHAWQQPILRMIDTIVGVAIGVAFAWAEVRVIRPRLRLDQPNGAAGGAGRADGDPGVRPAGHAAAGQPGRDRGGHAGRTADP